ncbi:MAG: hypothetical protein PHU86_02805 [Patescibacteria group bacterium]|jgi:hypothetical protein|nr:hypothetical protein [Patescibacteria group bacterium]
MQDTILKTFDVAETLSSPTIGIRHIRVEAGETVERIQVDVTSVKLNDYDHLVYRGRIVKCRHKDLIGRRFKANAYTRHLVCLA